MIEKRQESLLSQLEQLHERQELSVMEMFHQIGNTVEKIERGCKFSCYPVHWKYRKICIILHTIVIKY